MSQHNEGSGFLNALGLNVPSAPELPAKIGGQAGAFANIVRSGGRGPATKALIGAASGVGGLISGKGGRGFKEFGRDFTSGVTDYNDSLIAQDTGITVGKLRSRRRLKDKLDRINLNSLSLEDQIKAFDQIAQEASGEDIDVALRAATMRNSLKKQLQERDKAGLEQDSAEAEFEQQGLTNAFLKDGTPVTGEFTIQDGVRGLTYADINDKVIFKAFGAGLSREDPVRKAGVLEPLDMRIRKMMSKSDRSKVTNLVVGNATAMRKFDRVLSQLTDLAIEGQVESVMGDSGTIVSNVDNFVRNFRGVANAFLGGVGGNEDKKKGFINKWSEKAKDVNDSVWDLVELPAWARASSEEAQLFRSNIMDLAYMAARIAEPSNRGLSDNDIKNALIKIAGNTSSPEVMRRKFIELIADGAAELDYLVGSYYGSLENADGSLVSNERIARTLGGETFAKYQVQLNNLYQKYGVTVDEAGRATFAADVPTQREENRSTDPTFDSLAEIVRTGGDLDIQQIQQMTEGQLDEIQAIIDQRKQGILDDQLPSLDPLVQ